ncbi:MAG: hypothetical protein EZS28_052318 [Streblomastix strix]|uniref:Uncharacterized protein n=1 Tax=Streblomastix strix TaxID=222440 RepID=A0A5J4SAZ4_9EUKA|nr:MAG: hypothetical protein EZS28_052318 [Streblomastix strix]
MPKLADWCRQGSLGEFVKGNYSDTDSNLNELEGIIKDYSGFNSLSTTQIQDQQNHLQYFWSEVPVLKQANAVLNESIADQPLQITLKGSNLIAGNFYCKIVEIGSTSLITKQQNANMKFESLQYNAEEIIYPSEDGSNDPIDIVGSPENEQEATFGMKDASWMDTNKQYGILATNERRIFAYLRTGTSLQKY